VEARTEKVTMALTTSRARAVTHRQKQGSRTEDVRMQLVLWFESLCFPLPLKCVAEVDVCKENIRAPRGPVQTSRADFFSND
jgi:hypothetical protein